MFRDECCTETQPVNILYVVDDSTIAETVKLALEDEGWAVETCADGTGAMKIIASYEPYDVLVFDNQLPGINGIDLILQTRTLAHRQETPIIMLSGSDIEKEARRAGADVFLSKPQDVPELAETIARLLARKSKKR